MQLNQSFTVLYGAVAVALSLTAAIHALPTVPSDLGLNLPRSIGQNRTHEGVPVMDITPRAPSVHPIHLDLQSLQDASGYDVAFTTNIKLGDAKQVVPFRVDTGSSTVWAISTSLNQPGSQSGSDRAASLNWLVDYRDGSQVQGSKIDFDNVEIGDATLVNFPIGLADKRTGSLINFPVFGVLGFANGLQSRTGAPSVVQQLKSMNAIPHSIVGIKLDRPSPGRASTGRLTLGGSDPTQFSRVPGSFTSVNNFHVNNEPGYWMLSFSEVKVDNTGVTGFGAGILDTTAPVIHGSLNDVAAIHRAIPGSRIDRSSMFSLPCDTRVIISFMIKGVSFPMAEADLIGPRLGNECLSTIQVSPYFLQGQWSLGIPFFRNNYVILDSETDSIEIINLRG